MVPNGGCLLCQVRTGQGTAVVNRTNPRPRSPVSPSCHSKEIKQNENNYIISLVSSWRDQASVRGYHEGEVVREGFSGGGIQKLGPEE